MKPGNQKALIRHFQLTRNACRVEEFVITHSCVGESVCLCLLWCDNGLRVKTDTLYLLSSLSASGLFVISLSWLSFWFSLKMNHKNCASQMYSLCEVMQLSILYSVVLQTLCSELSVFDTGMHSSNSQISSQENWSVQDFTGTSALRLLIKDTDWLKWSSRCFLKRWLEPRQIKALSWKPEHANESSRSWNFFKRMQGFALPQHHLLFDFWVIKQKGNDFADRGIAVKRSEATRRPNGGPSVHFILVIFRGSEWQELRCRLWNSCM